MSLQSEIHKVMQKVGLRKEESRQLPAEVLRFDLTSASRFLYQKRIYDRIANVEGDIVECGVGWGRTLLGWAMLCHDAGDSRRIWGFDSFEGFPAPTEEDASPRAPKQGEWSEATLDNIMAVLRQGGLSPNYIRTKVTLVQGFFDKSLPNYTGDKIALLHIDADLYASYQTVLNQLYDKVAHGGVIAFDEYMGTREHYNFPGAKKAIDEFFADRVERIERDYSYGKYYAVKAA